MISKTLKTMFVMETKLELSELKRALDKIFSAVQGNTEQLDFLSRPEVVDILKHAQVEELVLAADLTFREQVEGEIRQYIQEMKNKKENKIKTGFKSYAIGRDQWKLEAEEVNFMKEKLLMSLTDTLGHYQKQARIRMNKK